MSTFKVEFDRIGRTHDVPPLTTTATDADELADAVWEYARRYLVSHDYDVIVRGTAEDDDDLSRGKVSIGYGRFGSGTFEEVAA
jgi:hypothetical protein